MKQQPVLSQLRRRKWNWLGHTLRKVTTALQNKYNSGHHRATEEGDSQKHLEERDGKRNVDNGLQVQLEENGGSRMKQTEQDGEEWSVAYVPLGAIRHKSSQSIKTL